MSFLLVNPTAAVAAVRTTKTWRSLSGTSRRFLWLIIFSIFANFSWRRFFAPIQGRASDIRIALNASKDARRVLRRLLSRPDGEALTHGYSPSWLAHFGGTMKGSVATVMSHYARLLALLKLKRNKENKFVIVSDSPDYFREYLTLSDGGRLGLDWVEDDRPGAKTFDPKGQPVVIVQHGLAGSSRSQYVRHMIYKLMDHGFRVVAFVSRGCGGNSLTHPNGYTAARTLDMREAVAHVRKKIDPNSRLYAVGFSLGACMLLKYLGEEGEQCPLNGAVCISPCFDFTQSHEHFDLWSRFHLVRFIKRWARENSHVLSLQPDLNLERALKSLNVREFDYHTVVREGDAYASVDDYYADASAIHVAHRITVPTLAVSSVDDPVARASFPSRRKAGPGLCMLTVEDGGHVAFPTGVLATGSWMDGVVVEWIEACQQVETHPGGVDPSEATTASS